ncbi:MAG: alpha/beta fold hydrolase [Actinomycetota bacterium]|nr:alpha/beta fold hydrolase [Actinomycetota bacterium]
MPANTYRFVEHWWVPGASPDEVYEVISDPRLLPRWWKDVYLESRPLGEWTEPRVGNRTRVKARGFLPYRLNFILETTALEPGRLVEVKTIGDFVGVWRATISSEPDGTRVDIDWRVTVEKPLIRFLSPVLKPLFAWNHYWTTPRGEAGLRTYLREHGEPKARSSQQAEGPSSRAVLRPDDFRHEMIQVGNLRMHAVIEGPEDGPLVVMLHGFPEFWYSWRYQIKAVAAAGYRVVAVDQRGYNLTDKRGPYDPFTLAADVARLIRTLGYEKANIVGHDWGGAIGWVIGARYPDIVEKLIACNAPHPSAAIAAWRSLYLPQIRRSWYMLAFQIPELPERLMSAKDYESLASNLKKGTRGALNDEELSYFKQAWSRPGALTGGINWYRALFRSWGRGHLKNLEVHTPSLLIWGDQDAFLTKRTAEWTRRYVPDLTLRYIRGASHWVQQDSPETVNRYMLDFLENPVSSPG